MSQTPSAPDPLALSAVARAEAEPPSNGDSSPSGAPGATTIENQKSKIKILPRAHNGKVARLPKTLRDQLNQMLLDGIPYNQIIRQLGDPAIPFNEINRVLDLGFRPLPWGDTGYLPSKYQPLEVGRVVPNAPPPSDTAPPLHPASSNGAPAVASPSVSTHELLKLSRQLKELMQLPKPPNP